jgi:predicted nucleic acid-binding Zn ribbon protein
MKNKRECPVCQTKYEPSRSDQKFCSDTCRWNAWREREQNRKEAKKDQSLAGTNVPDKTKEPEKKDLFASLRSVPENKATETKAEKTETAVQPKVEQEKVVVVKEIPLANPLETKEYKEAIAEKQRVDTFGKRVLNDLESCVSEINSINTEIAQLTQKSNIKQKMRFRNWDIDAEDLFGSEVLDKEIDHTFKSQELQQRLKSFVNQKTELHKELDQANRDMNIVMSKLKNIDQYEKPKPQEKKLDLANILKSIQSKKIAEQKQEIKVIEKVEPEQIETNINEAVETNVLEEENAFEDEENTNNGKLVSSRDLRKRKYNSFPFTGKWKDFFGLPSYAFHLAVHGKPGEGKSTFCVQFADYLAKNFGKVVYVSGEEGLSKTVQDKIINNGIDNPYLIFADIKSYDEIKTEIPNEFHFIFIDSLDTLRIDAAKLKALKEHYPQSAFITISQSTKDGKMRGSLEITHDTDIAAKVENGVALTTKNRFQARGTEFNVFPSPVKIMDKRMELPKNLI